MESKSLNKNTKRILVIGSGMMVEPLIDYLLKREENRITIGTNMIESAEKLLEKKSNKNITAIELDIIKDTNKLKELVRESDLVVSYVPPVLHIHVARICLEEKSNMITTSYVSEVLGSLNEQVKDANLIFMNEIGLDPGIDHLVTHKAIHEAEKRGEKIIHYESWCGALCSPEYLDNPLMYKFTWAPRGALLALNNNASQLINSKRVEISSDNLLTTTINSNFHPCFNFEGYYNRDSLPYKELYNLKDAQTVIRGTIRFKGFAFVFQCFKNLGLFNDETIDESIDNWRNYFVTKILKSEKNIEIISQMENKYNSKQSDIFITPGFAEFHSEINFFYKLSLIALSKFSDEYLKDNGGFNDLLSKIYSCLVYLDLCEDNNKLQSRNLIDAFAIMLEDKMKLKEWERDVVFMQNYFKLINKEGRQIHKKYDMVVFGRHNGLPYSAVSLLVSMPCAITAQLILDDKIKERGVLRPTSIEIINAVFAEMQRLNIYMFEHVEHRAKF